MDEQGTTRFGVAVAKNGPLLEFSDEQGKKRTVIGSAAPSGTSTGANEQKEPSPIRILGADGKVVWQAP